MNEQTDKLSELAEEAGLHKEWFIDCPEIEKFAELIVLECAVIVGSMEEPHQNIARLVKQHFGVE